MCIGVPMQVESGDAFVAIARCEAANGTIERHTLDMMIVGAQPPGAWVLAFRGAARRVLDPHEALRIRDALAALQLALGADVMPSAATVDALFADLVDRAPQLPEHLRRH